MSPPYKETELLLAQPLGNEKLFLVLLKAWEQGKMLLLECLPLPAAADPLPAAKTRDALRPVHASHQAKGATGTIKRRAKLIKMHVTKWRWK